MKNTLIALIALSTLMAGCAKVETQEVNCDSKPAKPTIDSIIVVPAYSYQSIFAVAPGADNLVWQDPTGSKVTNPYISVSGYYSDTYGYYKVWAKKGGCLSDPVVFHVVDRLPPLNGTPPCAPFSNNGYFQSGSSLWLNYSGSYLNSGFYYSNRYMIYGQDNNGSYMSIYLPTTTTPTTGTYYVIDSNSTSSSGGAFSYVNHYSGIGYTAVSGNIYIYSLNGYTSVAMCNVVWRSSAGRKSISGVCRYY